MISSDSLHTQTASQYAYFIVGFRRNRMTASTGICLALNALIPSEVEHLQAVWVYNAEDNSGQ
ncbi:hypothetical protein LRP49_23515 [Enterovibrio sp. ZSDZ35]|uniref:Uncharacterized protein n=1 Tax=Enterovibrio qingdaonensis TaxID=2899818 RepID=A0ABT5QT41_9GAMM|nr:hypothetical protein [Enterovibrio sp. ZSDZ35]MDD1784147.1 hypothetical protein [Enterovibrio sp. ZSDZ35]